MLTCQHYLRETLEGVKIFRIQKIFEMMSSILYYGILQIENIIQDSIVPIQIFVIVVLLEVRMW